MRFLFVILFGLTVNQLLSQKMEIYGEVEDDLTKTPLYRATVVVSRITDSVLVDFTRTDKNGVFELKELKLDTIQVIISHPNYGDKTLYLFGDEKNHRFDLGKFTLPAKSIDLNEFVIYANSEPVYYSGDTLIYNTDSFKVHNNATVEDLLKKLPGIQVDAQGKITSQGEQIDKVLVDGDEFFGSDPTIATRNLSAKGLEQVQIYEKKDENATANSDNETIKVLDIKLKEGAKKGYFGKVSAASDFNQFYEGEMLANKFNKQQKISVFGLATNTPKADFNFSDAFKFNVNGESNGYRWGNSSDYNTNENGIPQTIKGGFFYADKFKNKTKISINYQYNKSEINSLSDQRSQYFLADTSYYSDYYENSNKLAESHLLNSKIEFQLDSLTELHITPKITYTLNNSNNNNTTTFLSELLDSTRITNTYTSSDGNGYDATALLKLIKKFKKEDRRLDISYQINAINNINDNFLETEDLLMTDTASTIISFADQYKNYDNTNINHYTEFEYIEPITKKISIGINYDFEYNTNKQNKNTFDFINGEYNSYNDSLSNNFTSDKISHRTGGKFIYNVKKQQLIAGSYLQNLSLNNTNLITQENTHFSVNNILPYLHWNYRIKDNTRLNFRYDTKSNSPTINQLQPVPDNTNPNQVVIGNPNLKANYRHNANISFNQWSMITGRFIWANAFFSVTQNDFANSTNFDQYGKATIQTTNVNGNYNLVGNIGTNLPFYNKKLTLRPNYNYFEYAYSGFINNEKNTTKNISHTPAFGIGVEYKFFEISADASYVMNNPSSTINNQNNQPYSTEKYEGRLVLNLPVKFRLITDLEYNKNNRRAQGYNIEYLLWNASLEKYFGNLENTIISFHATDILNQNINADRSISNNIIIDSRTKIISRFFLLKFTYKFNSTKTKEKDEWWH